MGLCRNAENKYHTSWDPDYLFKYLERYNIKNIKLYSCFQQKNAIKLIKKGAVWCEDIKSLTSKSTLIINCLPNPKAISDVFESSNGLLYFINSNTC